MMIEVVELAKKQKAGLDSNEYLFNFIGQDIPIKHVYIALLKPEHARAGHYHKLKTEWVAALEFYYGVAPPPLRRVGSTLYDSLGRVVVDRILPISDGKIETEITDKHFSPKHLEHFDIIDRATPVEPVKIPQLNDPIFKMHFDTEGERIDNIPWTPEAKELLRRQGINI